VRKAELVKRVFRGNGEVIRKAAAVTVIQTIGIPLGFILQVSLLRLLGPTEFGKYAYVWAWITFLALFTSLGFAPASLRFIPNYEREQRQRMSASYLRASVAFALGASLLLALAVVVILPYTAGEEYRDVLSAGIWILPILSIIFLHVEILKAIERPIVSYLGHLVIRPAILLALLGGIVWVGIGVLDAHTALILTAITLGFVLLAQLPWLWNHYWMKGGRLNSRVLVDWMAVGIPLLVSAGFVLAIYQADILIVGLVSSPVEVGYYAICALGAGVLLFPLHAVNAVLSPRISREFYAGDATSLQQTMAVGANLMFWPSLFGLIVLFIFGRVVLSFVGVNAAWSFEILMILAVSHTVGASFGMVSPVLNLTGNQSLAARVTIITGITGLPILAYLAGSIGPVGAAYGAAATATIWKAALAIAAKKKLGVNTTIWGTSEGVWHTTNAHISPRRLETPPERGT